MKSKEQWQKELPVASEYAGYAVSAEWIGEVQEDATHELRSQLADKIAELEKAQAELRELREFRDKILWRDRPPGGEQV